MAKHFGFINGEGQTIDYMASSDTEKTAIQANLTPREISWVSVSDEDYAKGHNNTHVGILTDGAVNWTLEQDGSFETSKEIVQSEIDFNINEINRWLGTPRSSDATQRASWEAYRDTLSALDLSSTTTTFPITGNCSLKTLVDNGDLAEFKNIKRLP
tara:strand:+ start:1573 stop:2043 length:471 start_codon:yes stop_codon:yes gene_type:complete